MPRKIKQNRLTVPDVRYTICPTGDIFYITFYRCSRQALSDGLCAGPHKTREASASVKQGRRQQEKQLQIDIV